MIVIEMHADSEMLSRLYNAGISDVIIQYLSKSLLTWCTTTSIVLSFYYSTVCILSSTMNSRIQWQASEQKILRVLANLIFMILRWKNRLI